MEQPRSSQLIPVIEFNGGGEGSWSTCIV